jgi:hypothetical protein
VINSNPPPPAPPPPPTASSVARRRSSKNTYKPSKQFLEREKLKNNTTDDSDSNSSIRSSTTTIHNLTIGKIKRSKSLSRHSSLGSGEHKHQQKQLTKESRRLTTNDMTSATSLKQIHQSSDEAGDDDDEQKPSNLSKTERRIKSKTNTIEECITTRLVELINSVIEDEK